MEDYIFIIIAIVLSAIGAVNRSKKQKIARMKENDDDGFLQKRPSIFDQFLEEFDDEPDFVPQPAPTFKTVNEPKPKMQVTKTPANKMVDKPTKAPILIEEEENDMPIRASILEDFSLRKAVIYSEILNRKY